MIGIIITLVSFVFFWVELSLSNVIFPSASSFYVVNFIQHCIVLSIEDERMDQRT